MARMSEERIEHEIGEAGRLSVRAVAGDVKVTGTDGTVASVVARIHGGARLNVQKSDGALLVEQVQRSMLGGIFDRESIDFEVTVPRAAFLEVRTVSGDAHAKDLRGESSFNTVSGEVQLRHVAGRLSALTVSGDVQLVADGTIEISAITTSGDVDVEAERISRLGARSVSGDIDVAGLLEAGPRHAVETVSGDLSLDSAGGVSVETARAMDLGRERTPIVVGDGAARLVFRTMSGDHRIRGGRRQAAAAEEGSYSTGVPSPNAADASRMDVLRALERGEIDVEEASRRLEGVTNG
jgi:hypothetical protein